MADSLGAKLKTVIDNLPQDGVRLAEIRNIFGRDGLMLLAVFLTIPFMLPISIPGVSTVFGAAILLDRDQPSLRPQPVVAEENRASNNTGQ